MRIIELAIAATLAATAATAQTVDSRAAKGMLFSEKGAEAQVAENLDFVDAAVAKALKAVASQIPYYGAISVSPGEPTSSNLMSTMANFHSIEAATQAALDNCNARRTTGKPCVIVAAITPKRYKAQPLTLSVEATKAFNGDYRKLSSPKAMAISDKAGVFGYDRGDGGRAMSRCQAAAAERKASDCRLVIIDK
ncbi:5-aminolevulic acid synthase [Tropicimonas aquimaris]|uniref:5-aminolevulic acid synthase n=1 Tax=Tropicimonas aquimaris TaxID=914152 RepID=A0ABW3IRS9_9RHOB